MGKDKQKKEKYEEWGKLGFAGLILKAMTGTGKKSKKNKSKKNKDKLIEKDYWKCLRYFFFTFFNSSSVSRMPSISLWTVPSYSIPT